MTEFLTKYIKNINDKVNEAIKDWSIKKKTAVIIGVILVFFIGYKSIAGGIGNITSGFTNDKYVKLSQEEIEKLNCKELLRNNVGVRKEFCGQLTVEDWDGNGYGGPGMVYVSKQDLYNVNADAKFCGSLNGMIFGHSSCGIRVVHSQKLDQIAKRATSGAIVFKGKLRPATGEYYYDPFFDDITFIDFNDPGINW